MAGMVKNILTFDWEEWLDTASMEKIIPHGSEVKVLESGTERFLEMARPRTATFFVLACHVKKYAGLVRRIAGLGHEIALHGLFHTPMWKYSPVSFREDILTAKKIVEDVTGEPVLGFRAPNFSMTEKELWALDVLVSMGFKYDSSMPMHVFLRAKARGVLPIREIPRSGAGPGMLLPFNGGAFLRAYPYMLTRFLLGRLNQSGRRGMVYVHPWELNRLWVKERNVPWHARLVMGFGGSTIEKKIGVLLNSFHFSSIRDILQEEMAEV